MTSVSITFRKNAHFDDVKLGEVIRKYSGICESRTSGSVKKICRFLDHRCTLQEFETKLTIQSVDDFSSNGILYDLSVLKGLTFDGRGNLKKFLQQVRPPNGTFLCLRCAKTSHGLILSKGDSGFSFRYLSCEHEDINGPPMFITRTRLLPDINQLISGNVSRLIDLGFLNNFEILLPTYVTSFVDTCIKGKLKSGFDNELNRLKTLEDIGKITIKRFDYKIEVNSNDCERESNDEDEKIVYLARLSGSILMTGDRLMKTLANVDDLSTFFIPQDLDELIKVSSV